MKKSERLYIGVFAAVALIIAGIFLLSKPATHRSNKPVKPDLTPLSKSEKPVFRKDGELRFIEAKSLQTISKIDIEVADNDASREQGLMYRDSMAPDQGMLFIMEREEPQSFWMKNTIIPLDIIFVNSDREIVTIKRDCKPYSLDQILSENPAQYVVEVNAGYAKSHLLKPRDRIIF